MTTFAYMREELRERTSRPIAFYGPGGALMLDREVEGLTFPLEDHAAEFYGGRWMVGESMSIEAARRIAIALGMTWSNQPAPFREDSEFKKNLNRQWEKWRPRGLPE